MPYKLRKAPKRDLYWVVGLDGKHHSKDPLPKERAEAQMKALYSAMRREEEAVVPNAKEEKAIEKKMEGGGTSDDIAKIQGQIDGLKQQQTRRIRKDQRAANEHHIANLEKILTAMKEGEAVETLKEMEGANALLSLKKGNGHTHSLHGAGPLPELSILQQIAKAAYSTSPPQTIGPFRLGNFTPTLKFYTLADPSDPRDVDTVVVGIRGTNTSDKQDIYADAKLGLGQLEDTPRWKKDLADFTKYMSRFKNGGVDIYGVGHSLGGAVLDMFLKKGLIRQGVSYNPAISLGDAQKDIPNRRIYQDGDPLLALMGRSAKNVEIRPKKVKEHSVGRKIANAFSYFIPYVGLITKGMDTLDAHALDNFTGGASSTYLRQARAKAKAYGLDPKKLKLATDGKHKLDYDGVKFGLKHYNDFLLWSAEEKAGRVPAGTAEKKRKLYRARAEKIKGEWKANKTSPNNLAIHILW